MDKENNVISLAEDASEVFEAYLKSGHGAMFSMYASKSYKGGFACGWNMRGQVKATGK